MTIDNPKPCPFCAEATELELSHVENDDYTIDVFIECRNCGSLGPVVYCDNIDPALHTVPVSTASIALGLWNKRGTT